MTDLVQIPKDFKKEFRVDDDGKVTASIRGTARLADIDESSIRKSLKSGAGLKPSSIAKYLIEYGFEGAGLELWIDQGIPGMAVNAILEYYAYECPPRYRKEQAKVLCRAFRNYGYEKWFQKQLGWQPENKLEKPMSLVEMFSLQAKINEENAKKIKKVKQEQQQHSIKISEMNQIIADLTEKYDYLIYGINAMSQHRLEIIKAVHKSELLCEQEPNKIPVRKKIWRLANMIALAANCLPEEVWNEFYKQLFNRYNFDAKARAKNQKISPIDAVEQAGKLDELHAIATDIYKELCPELDRQEIVQIPKIAEYEVVPYEEAKPGDYRDNKHYLRVLEKTNYPKILGTEYE